MKVELRQKLAAALSLAQKCEHPGAASCDPWWQADAALAVFAEFLRDEATADSMAAETTEYHFLQYIADECICGQWREDDTGQIHDQHVARAGLAFLATSIATQEES